MSLIKYRYHNAIDYGTVLVYSSQLSTLPAANVQKDILSKVWKTEDGFVITTSNQNLPFRDMATGSVINYPIPSATYTGSGLATKMQSGLNSVGTYADHSVLYNSVSKLYVLSVERTSTGLFELHFDTTADKTVAILLGFGRNVKHSGTMSYTSTNTTMGNEHLIEINLTSTQTVSCFIIDNHDLSSTAFVRLRGAKTATGFGNGGWKTSTYINLSTTITPVTSGTIVEEFTECTIKTFQLYWYDRDKANTSIGRLWFGPYFQPQYQQSNLISWRGHRIGHRSRIMVAVSGAQHVDKRDPIDVYRVRPDFVDPYYSAASKLGFETMVAEVGDHTPFYISFDKNIQTSTVYGFVVGDWTETRVANTPALTIGEILFREQK